MDYEKKYKDAVSKIKSIIADKKKQGLTNCLFEGDLNEIFPELKESEDERIRKELIRLLNVMTDGIVENYTTTPLRDFVAWLEKQGEQKPIWSEEDKKQLERAIYMMEQLNMTKSWDDVYNWLKSIKPQPHWKPTEEQMSMLLAVLNDSNNITAESAYIALKSLYNDLKKL